EEFLHVPRGVFTDGDDSLLPVRQPTGDDAAVEHAFPIIFFGDVKWREVVNGRYERTWPRPKHPAIARNVENIELQAADESRQSHLMPENIFDRRAKLFRDQNDLSVVLCKREQWKVFFEHEQNEFVLLTCGQQRPQQREDVLAYAAFA